MSTRPLGILRDCWHEYNNRYFAGELTPVPITPGGPWKNRLGDFSPAQKRIRLGKLNLGRFSDPKVRTSVAGTLLHEMVHQWIDATTGDRDDNHRHGPKFTAKCNEIGARLGLADVVHRKPRGRKPSWPSAGRTPCGRRAAGGGGHHTYQPAPAGATGGDTWQRHPGAGGRPSIVAGYQDEEEYLS